MKTRRGVIVAFFRQKPTLPARGLFVGLCFRKQERKTIGNTARQIFLDELVTSLDCFASAESDELTEIAVAFAIGREQYQTRPVFERDLGSDNEFEFGIPRCFMRADDSSDRTLVGQSKRVIAEFFRALDEFLRVRRTA